MLFCFHFFYASIWFFFIISFFSDHLTFFGVEERLPRCQNLCIFYRSDIFIFENHSPSQNYLLLLRNNPVSIALRTQELKSGVRLVRTPVRRHASLKRYNNAICGLKIRGNIVITPLKNVIFWHLILSHTFIIIYCLNSISVPNTT